MYTRIQDRQEMFMRSTYCKQTWNVALLVSAMALNSAADYVQAVETVVVRTNTPLSASADGGAADTRYAGFLHSLAPTLPGAAYFEALRPAAFRTGVLTNLSGGFVGDF